jgi:hypothetical protein
LYALLKVALILNRLMVPRALVRVADWVAQAVLTQTLGVWAKFNFDMCFNCYDLTTFDARRV